MGEAKDSKTAPTPSSAYYLLAHTFNNITTALSASIYLQNAADSQSLLTKTKKQHKNLCQGNLSFTTLSHFFRSFKGKKKRKRKPFQPQQTQTLHSRGKASSLPPSTDNEAERLTSEICEGQGLKRPV